MKVIYIFILSFSFVLSRKLKITKKVLPDHEAERWTNFTEEPQMRGIAYGNGTAKVLLVGNSFGYRTFPVLLERFRGRFKEFRLYTKSSATILGGDNNPSFDEAYRIVLKNMRPDIVFIIALDCGENMKKPIIDPIEEDEIMIQAQRNVNYFNENARAVVIDYQLFIPEFKFGVADIIQSRLSIEDYNMDDLETSYQHYLEEMKNDITRTDYLRGYNIYRIRVQKELCTTGTCPFLNRLSYHSYYGDKVGHPTPELLNVLRPSYGILIDKLLNDQGKRSKDQVKKLKEQIDAWLIEIQT